MNPKIRISLVILLVTLSLLPAAPSQASPHPLQMDTVIKRAAAVTAEAYPEADTALVDDFLYTRYEKDGTYVTWDDMAYKILTQKGRDSLKTLSTYYSAAYSRAAILFVEVYKPNGTVQRPNLKNLLREMSDPGQMRSNIYDPNNKIITVNVPDLQIGDVVRFCTRRELFKPRYPNAYSDIVILESDELIVNYDILIDAPKELPLKKIVIRNPIGNTVKASQKKLPEGRIHYRWNAKDVPVMIPEPQMPRRVSVAQRLMVSTIGSWHEVSSWYWNLCQPRMKPSPEMRAKVAQLTKGLKARRDIVNAIFKFVSQEIRYLGITLEDDAPGYEPHDVALTFSNRHGVCRDKAALLAAMLRLANVEAFPVLIMAGDKIDQEVCLPYFNHAITAALDDDGSYILMDSTDENTRDLFPSYLADKSYIVARKEGETLQTSPFSPAKDNLITIKTTGSIDEKGTLEATATLNFNGINDNAYRGFFANASTDDKKAFVERAVNAIAPGATITELNLKPANAMDTNVPLTLTVRFKAKKIFSDNNRVAMLNPPQLARSFGLHNNAFRSAQLDSRKYPYLTKMALGVKENVELTVSPVWGTPETMPTFENLDDKLLTWKRQSSFRNHVLTMQTIHTVNAIEYAPQDYLKVKSHIKTIDDNNRKRFIFIKAQNLQPATAGGQDAEIISQTTTYNLTDANTWMETRDVTLKILTYKGKKENSELMVTYFPDFQKLKLEKAEVTTVVRGKDGKSVMRTQHVKPEDIQTMDQNWVAKAPRYPRGKILVVPLPGVQEGSTISYRITKTTSGAASFFSLRESFRLTGIPIRHKALIVNAPAQLKLATAVFQNGILANNFKTHQNNISETFVTENNRTIWQWTAANQPPIPEERNQAMDLTFTPTVCISAKSWNEFLTPMAQQLRTKAAENGPTLEKLVQNLRKVPESKRLKQVNRVLATAVSLAGPSFLRLPTTTLSAPEQTLKDGYGHSADKAILAFAVLKKLGYHPEFIFAATQEYPQNVLQQLYSTPSHNLFAKLLVKVVSADQTFWFNDQDQYAELRSTTAENHMAMTENAQLFTVSTPDDAATLDSDTINLDLDDGGNANMAYHQAIRGTDFATTNKLISELTPELRKRLNLSMARQFSPRAKLTSELVATFSQYPGKLAFTCAIPRFATLDGKYVYFRLPLVSFKRLPFHISDNRETPLARNRTQNITRTFNLTLPPSFRKMAMIPQDYQWQSPDGTTCFTVKVTTPTPNTITLTYQAILKPTVVTAEQFPNYRKLEDVIAHDNINTILLTK